MPTVIMADGDHTRRAQILTGTIPTALPTLAWTALGCSRGGPVLSDGSTVVTPVGTFTGGADDIKITAYNLGTGAQIWQVSLPTSGQPPNSMSWPLAIYDTTVYAARVRVNSDVPESSVYGLNIATGAVLWTSAAKILPGDGFGTNMLVWPDGSFSGQTGDIPSTFYKFSSTGTILKTTSPTPNQPDRNVYTQHTLNPNMEELYATCGDAIYVLDPTTLLLKYTIPHDYHDGYTDVAYYRLCADKDLLVTRKFSGFPASQFMHFFERSGTTFVRTGRVQGYEGGFDPAHLTNVNHALLELPDHHLVFVDYAGAIRRQFPAVIADSRYEWISDNSGAVLYVQNANPGNAENGLMIAFAPDPQQRILWMTTVPGTFHTPPALVGTTLFLNVVGRLFCYVPGAAPIHRPPHEFEPPT